MIWKTLYKSKFGVVNPTLGANSFEVFIQKLVDEDDGSLPVVIDLPYDSPLVIDWEEQGKEVPVCGSTATLKIICNNDREFLPLMMSEPGTVRLVCESVTPIWRGVLDTRQCEEPYAYNNGYIVELTFTDFGMLDRMNFDANGVMTGEELVRYIIGKSGLDIPSTSFIFMCATSVNGVAGFDKFSFRCDNFFDEDGVGMSLKEVLDAILQPFMLKITQKVGRIFCYDLKSMYDVMSTEIVEWMGTNQLISFDRYVNRVKVSFSTYSNATLRKEDIDLTGLGTDFEDSNLVNLFSTEYYGVRNPYYSMFPNLEDVNIKSGRNNASYTMHIMRHEDGRGYDLDGVSYYDNERLCPIHITSLQGGDDGDGFVAKTIGNHVEWANGQYNYFEPMRFGSDPVWGDDGQPIFIMDDIYVPPMSGGDANKFKIKLQMDMMVDPRYNPFSDADNNYKDNYDYCNAHHNHTFVKLKIQLRNANGDVVAHYSNAPFLYDTYRRQPWDRFEGAVMLDRLDRWGKGSYPEGANRYVVDMITSQGAWYDNEDWSQLDIPDSLAPYCWLDYYDKSNIDDSCGVLGWSTNRHNVSSMARLSPTLSALDAGQYIPYPSEGGYIHIEVMHGYHQWPNAYPWWPNETRSFYDDKSRHVMYKLPKLTIVKSNIKMDDAEFDDVEVDGVVNDNGVEDMTLATKCGSSRTPMPTAKGCVLDTATLSQVKSAERGGFNDTLENLMIGTLYSQFHGHKITLSGKVKTHHGLCKYIVDTELDKFFVNVGEVADLKDGTSEVKLAELCDETYQREQ